MERVKRVVSRGENVADHVNGLIFHDIHITRIAIRDNDIIFYFDDGFYILENGILQEMQNGYMRFFDAVEGTVVWCLRRKPSRKGQILSGRDITLKELRNILRRKNMYIEFYDDMVSYDKDRVYMRGELYYRDKIVYGLMPYIIIDFSEFDHIVYGGNKKP